MVPALVIMLREGIEAALVVGIVLTYLRRTERGALIRVVYLALGAAVIVCVAVAAVFELVGLDAEDPRVEAILLGVAGLFVLTMVLWMWRATRGLKASMEARLDAITQSSEGRAATLGLFGFTFVMVLREGIEAVLFLKAAALGAQANAASFLGAVLGLGLATTFAVLFVRGGVRIDLRRFFRYTSIALLVLAAKLLVGSVHALGELGLLPLTSGVVDALGEIAEGTVGGILTSAVIGVPVLLLLWEITAQVRCRVLRRDAGRKEPCAGKG